MEAHDLVQLDQLGPPPEPLREAGVKICTRLLRQRFVRRVADQQVPEAEGVVIGERRVFRSDQLLPDEADEVLLHAGTRGFGRQLTNRRAVEDLPLDGAPLDEGTLLRAE